MLKIYVLDVSPLISVNADDELYEAVREKIDDYRLKLLEKYKKNKSAYGLSAGAGLILQYAFTEYYRAEKENGRILFKEPELSDVLSVIDNPIQVSYTYGEDGKPAIEGNVLNGRPLFFNLSHSGSRVCVAVADCEVGADIQINKAAKCESMAEKFFTKYESDAVKEKGTDYFFRLWSRKEAYGKCLGNGVRPAFEIDFTDLSVFDGFEWFEKDLGEYCLTVCCRK